MLTRMRTDVKKVLEWQQSVLGRLNQIASLDGDGAVSASGDGSAPDADVTAFRHFVEASIAKLTSAVE